MYRGVTRSYYHFLLMSHLIIVLSCLLLRKIPLKSLFLLRFLADITSMDGGKLELAELQGTRTFILGHSVSYFLSLLFSLPFP